MPPTLIQSNVQIPGRGVVIKGFLAYPEGAIGLPGVVIHPGAPGLTDDLRGVAKRFADAGYAALVYDLYSRQPDAPAGAPYMEIAPYYKKITDKTALMDLDSAMEYFRSLNVVDPERTGILGFCSAYATVFACHDVRLRACISFYSQVHYVEEANADTTVSPIDRIPSLWCPFQGHYGDDDTVVSMDEVNQLESALKKYAKQYEMHTYPGAPHGFFNEGNRHQPSADLAWPRVLDFLRTHLGG